MLSPQPDWIGVVANQPPEQVARFEKDCREAGLNVIVDFVSQQAKQALHATHFFEQNSAAEGQFIRLDFGLAKVFDQVETFVADDTGDTHFGFGHGTSGRTLFGLAKLFFHLVHDFIRDAIGMFIGGEFMFDNFLTILGEGFGH